MANTIKCNNGNGYLAPLRCHRIINILLIVTNKVSKLIWLNFLLRAVFTFEKWLIVLILYSYKNKLHYFFQVFSILKSNGNRASTCSDGYWPMPVSNSVEGIEAVSLSSVVAIQPGPSKWVHSFCVYISITRKSQRTTQFFMHGATRYNNNELSCHLMCTLVSLTASL